MQPQSIGGIAALTFLFVFFVWYHFFYAPRKGARIATECGFSYKTWYDRIWAFGIFAVTYLFFSVEGPVCGRRRSLIWLGGGYLLIFAAALGIDFLFPLHLTP